MCHQFCHTWYTWYYIKWSVPHLVCAVSVQTQRGFCAVLPILRKLLPWPHLLTMFWIDEFKLFKNFPTKPQISRYPVECMQFNKQIYLRDIWYSVQLSFLLESWPSTSPPWDDWRDWEQDLVSDCCWFCSTRKTFQGDKRKIAKQSPSLSPDLWYLSHWIKSSDWSTSLAPFYIWLLTTYYWPWTSNFSQLNFFVYGFSRPCNCDTVRRTVSVLTLRRPQSLVLTTHHLCTHCFLVSRKILKSLGGSAVQCRRIVVRLLTKSQKFPQTHKSLC